MLELTQHEADRLIAMLKRKVDDTVYEFPKTIGELVFDVVGDDIADVFIVNISRKGLNGVSCSYQGRIKKEDTLLLRFDINPNGKHKNPDGSYVSGSHFHIFSEKTKMAIAIPLLDNCSNLYEFCFTFFLRFNIVSPPQILNRE
jgi:hypothetical protein